MSRALIVAFALLSGCSPWVFPEPAKRFALPTALGSKVPVSGAVLRPLSLSLATTRTRAIISVTEGSGYDTKLNTMQTTDTQWYAVTAPGTVSAISAPPAVPDHAWASALPDTLFATSGAQVLTFDSSNSWHSLPALSAPPVFAVQADETRAFARVNSTAYVLANGAWHDLSSSLALPANTTVYFGPSSASAVRLFWLEGTSLSVCTQLVDTTLFTPSGAKVCKLQGGNPLALMGDAINGTVDDFQVALVGQANANLFWHFINQRWERGQTTTAQSLLATPGLPEAYALPTHLPAPQQIFRYTQGRGAGTVYSTDTLLKGCALPECQPVQSLFDIASDVSAVWLLSVNVADATRSVFIKRVALPLPEVTCTPACTATQRCIEIADGTNSCVLDETVLGVNTGFPATTKLQVVTETGTVFPPVNVTNTVTGEALAVSARVDGLAQVLDLPPNTPVTLSFEVSGYPTQQFSYVTQNDNTQTDLGAVQLARGLRVGRVAKPATAPVLADQTLLLPVLQPDGGAVIAAVTDSNSSVQVSKHLEVGPAAQLVASPSGKWVLIEEGQQLSLLDLSTSQRASLASSAITDQWSSAVFSRDGTAVAVSRPQSGVSVLSLALPPVERFTAVGTNAVNPAQLVQLSRDGNLALIKRNTGFALVSATADTPITGNFTDAFLSGDGTRLYTALTVNSQSTLAVRATSAGAMPTDFATQVTAFAVDLDGADLLYTTIASPNRAQVSRYVAATGTVTAVTQLQGVGVAFPRAGALWVTNGAGTCALFFPASLATPRTIAGNSPTAVDPLGRLQLTSGTSTRIVSEQTELLTANGPGVFRADASRRVNAQQLTLESLQGTGVTSTKTFAPGGAGVTLAPLFVDLPMRSLGAPCALFTVPARQVSVEATTGVATWSVIGADVQCVP